MLYYILIALQILCAYHVYKTQNSYYWYFVIILVPGLGCAIYVLTQILNKNDTSTLQKELVSVMNPSRRIKGLEEKIAFSDTFQNRINLADALFETGDYAAAEKAYQEALKGSDQSDYYGNTQLLSSLFEQEKYEEVVAIAQKIKGKPDFNESRGQFLYGLALSETGKEELAEEILKKIDRRYSNYPERLELAKFYLKNKNTKEAHEIIEELKAEYLNLTKTNKKIYKNVFIELDKLVVPV